MPRSPLADALLSHPRVQKDAQLRMILTTCTDLDRFKKLPSSTTAFYLGYVFGVVQKLLDELDATALQQRSAQRGSRSQENEH